MDLLGSLAIAFSMYSRIPMPQVEWTGPRMKYAMCFFPLVGLIIGLLIYGGYLVLAACGLAKSGWLILAAVPLVVTGGIHMDGFLDVTDAMASHADRERKLEILKDPHVGAFAVIGCSVYLLFYAAALGEMKPEMLPAYGAVFVLSRAFSGLAVVVFPKAKNTGLAAAFSGQAQKRTVAVTMLAYIGASLVWISIFGGIGAGIFAAAGSLGSWIYYYRMAKREFGGITGDLAGYFLQICELVLLMALAVLSRLTCV